MKIRLILLCVFLCTACMPPEKILERQGISTIIGFDLLDENTYKGTISLLQFDRKEEKDECNHFCRRNYKQTNKTKFRTTDKPPPYFWSIKDHTV